MGMKEASESAAGSNHATVKRKSERELVITRRFAASARLVFAAWTTPELLKK